MSSSLISLPFLCPLSLRNSKQSVSHQTMFSYTPPHTVSVFSHFPIKAAPVVHSSSAAPIFHPTQILQNLSRSDDHFRSPSRWNLFSGNGECDDDDFKIRVGDELLPDSIDWRELGAVTDVQDQGRCGSSWGFATAGSIEGAVYKRTGILIPFSVQQLVDCVYLDRDSSKTGGTAKRGFQYVMNHDLLPASRYPYTGRVGKCRVNSESHGIRIKGFHSVPPFDEKALQRAVWRQPVAASIRTNKAFSHYTGGLFKIDCEAGSRHAVLIVGYGRTRDGEPYWIIKNSYGTAWGEGGYMRMIRNYTEARGLMCIASRPVYPVY